MKACMLSAGRHDSCQPLPPWQTAVPLQQGLLQGVRMTGVARGIVGAILGRTCCDRDAGMGLPTLLCGVP